MMSLPLPKIYSITDLRLSGLSHAEQVERMAEGGATLIQLREKFLTPREFYLAALEAMKVARRLGVKIIINDRVDIALAVNADGVHLGQDDLPPDRARELMGAGRIIGYSTHNPKQALEADSMPIDYVALGPVFQTTTKVNPDPVIGAGIIRQVKAHISKPLVAIGGISLDRVRSTLTTGADSLAIISDLFSTDDLAERVKAFLKQAG